jgi:tRNA A-37 threonylcarbamoyl transferase component Bud32
MTDSPLICYKCGAENSRDDRACFSCGTPLQTSSAVASATLASPGQDSGATLLKQRYRVVRSLGKGGMGTVYLAQDTQLGDRAVALKKMTRGTLTEEQKQQAVENFRREAYMLARLQHPNLPNIYDHFEEDGHWYLVMSFIQGEALDKYLARAQDQRLPLQEVLFIGRELCNVLAYLHQHQPPIIFRDLKPSNIMLSSDGHIYLIDFGIARHFKPEQTRDTNHYASLGYAPPEQFGQSQTTEQSDIYSLGVTLYQLLSGYSPVWSPFRLPPLQSLVPTLPDQLVRLITWMLELDARKRPANVKIVLQELHRVVIQLPSPMPGYETAPLTPEPHKLVEQGLLSPPFQIHAGFALPPTRHPPRGLFSVMVKVLRITVMVVGILLAVIGVSIALGGGGNLGVWNDLSTGAGTFFFGLMLFFIARIRMSRVSRPLPRARQIESLLGACAGMIAALCGLAFIIATLASGKQDFGPDWDFGDMITSSIFIIIIGVIMFWVTRIRVKKP